MEFDQSLFQTIYALAHQSAFLDGVGIFLARFLPWILIMLFVVRIVLEKNWRVRFYDFSLVLLSVILAKGVIAEIINFFYYRPRPPVVLSIVPLIPVPGSPAFPSGHATIFFALAMAIWFISRRWGWWFLGAAALIAVARVYTGVHWPLDVLAGTAIGIISAVIVRKLLPPLERYTEHAG